MQWPHESIIKVVPYRRESPSTSPIKPNDASFVSDKHTLYVSFILGQRGGILFFLFLLFVSFFTAPRQRIFFRACECGTTTVKGIRFATRYRSILLLFLLDRLA